MSESDIPNTTGFALPWARWPVLYTGIPYGQLIDGAAVPCSPLRRSRQLLIVRYAVPLFSLPVTRSNWLSLAPLLGMTLPFTDYRRVLAPCQPVVSVAFGLVYATRLYI